MKFIAASIFILLANVSFSQATPKESINRNDRFNYGFNLGLNYSQIRLFEEPPKQSSMSNGAGFRLGIISEYEVNQWFSISPKAELSFNGAKLGHPISNTESSTYGVNPVTLEFMSHFNIKKTQEVFGAYIYVGPNINIALNKESNTHPHSGKNNLAIDVGLAFDIDCNGFHLAPELRYSYGLKDINNNPIYGEIRHHNIALILNFLG